MPYTGESRTHRRAMLGLSGAAAAGALGMLPGAGQAGADRDGAPIVGTWLSRSEGTTRPLVFLWFFFPGGILQRFESSVTETTSRADDPAAREYQTAAGGAWLRTGFTSYAYRLIGVDYDERGLPIGTDEIAGRIEYDLLRDIWSGTTSIRDLDPAGAVREEAANPIGLATRITVAP